MPSGASSTASGGPVRTHSSERLTRCHSYARCFRLFHPPAAVCTSGVRKRQDPTVSIHPGSPGCPGSRQGPTQTAGPSTTLSTSVSHGAPEAQPRGDLCLSHGHCLCICCLLSEPQDRAVSLPQGIHMEKQTSANLFERARLF